MGNCRKQRTIQIKTKIGSICCDYELLRDKHTGDSTTAEELTVPLIGVMTLVEGGELPWLENE